MSHASPTFSQIKAQVAAIREKRPHARSIAIRTKGRWTGEPHLADDDATYAIHQCDSPLAMRIALREGGDDSTNVLITNLDERDVGEDILLRLTPRRFESLDGWQIVKTLFQAHAIDPRIGRQRWIAEMLMEIMAPEGFPPTASGFLDAETVWPILLRRMVGLDVAMPDLVDLLRWSTDCENVTRFQSVSEEFREAAIVWLEGVAGPTAATILRCVAREKQPDALPIGLAVGVVFHPEAASQLDKAAGKMEERYLGGASPPLAAIAAWHAAATELVRVGGYASGFRQQLLARADEILVQIGADSHAWRSDTSPMGFALRMTEFGKRLGHVVSSRKTEMLEPLTNARDAVFRHDMHRQERRRLERVDMAMRLVRWLSASNSSVSPASLAEAASDYLHEGGFVDWARLTLRAGDPVYELSKAYAKLFERVTAVCEERSHAFALLLRDWTAAKKTDTTLVPVEEILDRIVSPLVSGSNKVLVIVMDGMGAAVFRELMDDIAGREWILRAEEAIGLRPALATVPSVTEASRVSLLCGRLTQGNAATEKAGFAEHPGLLAKCRAGSPPLLFHKASLQESQDASLAAEVRKEIASTHRYVVGVVVNAVDDHLLKGEQMDTRWTCDAIKVFPTLLHEARMAGRTVIFVGDHGHVLDAGAKSKSYEAGGERWRMDEGEPGEDELQVCGARVVLPESKRLIAPWTEKVHYGVKKNGYHGGLSPQEMVVPIGVLTPGDVPLAGWTEAPVDIPDWWEASAVVTEPSSPAPKLKPPTPKETAKPKGMLFPMEEIQAEPPVAVAAGEKETTPAWIGAFLSSPIFEAQKSLGGRAVPGDKDFTELLAAIDARGGKITSSALAKAIQLSQIRLRGRIAVAQRVLNVDGYAVLTRDDASDTVELDRDLLCLQFDLVQ